MSWRPASLADVPTPRPEADDGRVRIRRYDLADADALYEAVRSSLSELSAFLPWAHPAYSREDAVAWASTRAESMAAGSIDYAIEELATGRFVGGVGLNAFDLTTYRCNLGYWVRSDATGQGFATCAAVLMARLALEDLAVQRVEIMASVHNHASLRVAERTGAVREAVLTKHLKLHGELHDVMLYRITPGWRPPTRP